MAAVQIPLNAKNPEVQYDILIEDVLKAFLEQVAEPGHGTPLCKPRKSSQQ